jgi:hypothetical protein
VISHRPTFEFIYHWNAKIGFYFIDAFVIQNKSIPSTRTYILNKLKEKWICITTTRVARPFFGTPYQNYQMTTK